MKSNKIIIVTLVSIFISDAANAIDDVTKQKIMDAGTAFNNCRNATANTPEGQVVYNEVMAFKDASYNKPNLMMDSKSLSAKQKKALEVVYANTKECQGIYLDSVNGTPVFDIAKTRFSQVEAVYNKMVGKKTSIAIGNVVMSEIREDYSSEIRELLSNSQ